MGIKDLWTASSPVNKKDVDIILGADEKGRASAWIKNWQWLFCTIVG